jgi:hypothetical protein
MNVYLHKPQTQIMTKRGRSTQPMRQIKTKFDPLPPDLSQFLTSNSEARKLRIEKWNDVQKLHIRIASLEKEEELAKKKIDEARLKAISMLKKQISKEETIKKIQEMKSHGLSIA